MKIFDAHVHIFADKIAKKATDATGNYYGVKMYSIGILENVLSELDSGSIDGCLIHSTATKAEQVQSINTFIATLKNKYPQFVGFGTMHPDLCDIEAETRRMADLGLLGIKLHPDFQNFAIDDERAYPIYRAAIKNKLPILFHAGDAVSDLSSPVRIRNIHNLFPELTIIAAHLGGFRMWEAAKQCLVGQDIYMDLSSALPFIDTEYAREIILSHGTDKVLFGSDFPMHSPKDTVELVKKLGFSEKQNEQIFYKNAEKLLNITV